MLTILASFTSLLVAWRSWKASPRLHGWSLISAFIIALGAAAHLFDLPTAAWCAFGIWLFLLVVPMSARVLAQFFVRRRRYRWAVFWGRVMALLHPADDWPALARLMVGLHQAQCGRHEEALTTFHELSQRRVVGWQARAYALAIACDWQAIVAQKDTLPRAGLALVARAFGETGQWDSMVRCFAEMGAHRSERPAELRMVLAAFVGRPDIVRRLNQTALAASAAANRLFWEATAEQSAGNRHVSDPIFQRLLKEPDRIIARSARQRLEQPLEPVGMDFEERLEPPLGRVVRHAWRTSRRDDVIPYLASQASRWPVVTWGFMALLAGWFVAQGMAGGVDNPRTLMVMGALRAPEGFLEGEYWRFLTAGWLHYGWAHLAMNMAGLWLFGRFAEAALGRWRMGALYVLSGLAAMITWYVLHRDIPEPRAVVGASASIMGLVGAALVIMVTRYRLRLGGRRNVRELWMVGSMVLMQLLFDTMVPESSMVGHGAGALWGVLLTLAWRHPSSHTRGDGHDASKAVHAD